LAVSGGTQTLSGTNTYSGGTTIAAGTLQIGGGGIAGSIVGDVADNGTLAFDRADSSTFTGTISGTGGVSQIGGGTTALTATNTYTGGTTITAGTLQIGNGGTTGSITGNVVDNGTLAFDRSDPVTWGAAISGTGAVTQIGTGTLALTAVNSYTGTTTIGSNAVMTLGASGSIAASSGVTVNGTFDVSAGAIAPQIASLAGAGAVTLGSQSLTLTKATGTFSGAISGSGGLVLAGGTQSLSGTNSYTGATTISGGSLAVNGSIASSSGVTVNSGGTLSGAGTVPTTIINAGGTLAPGAAGAGTLNVSGTVAFAGASNFVVNTSSASAPKLLVSGAEALAGTLSVASTDGTYLLGQKVAVLTANGGITGSFALAQIQSTGAAFSPKLSYDANNAYLEIDLAKLSPLLPANATTNQVNAVGGIDAAIAAGTVLPVKVQNLGNLSSTSLGTDAGQLAGELGSDLAQVGNSSFEPFLNTITDHMRDGQQSAPAPKRRAAQQGAEIWTSAFTSVSTVAGDPGTAGTQKLKSTVGGIVGGVDWRMSPQLVVGGAISLGSTAFHLADNFGTGKADTIQAGLYGFAQLTPRLYNSFAAALAVDSFTTNRSLTVSGSDSLTGKLTAEVFGGRYEAGANLSGITPYLALQDKLVRAPGYSETALSGSDTFALSYAGQTTNIANLEAGFRQILDLPMQNGTLRLSDKLAWSHELPGTREANASFAALPDSGFTSFGAQPAKDSALISLGVALNYKNGLGFNVHFDDAISGNSQTYNEIAGLNYSW
jgi:fibronectin-binding autotransporter adhesin